MKDQLQVGLIGYGYAGKTFHAPVITSVPKLKLAKVVERSSDHSKKRYPWVEMIRDVKDLYADESIDIVVVTTPSTNHYPFVKEALLNGKHVVVEKPFTPTTREADELIALAKEKGKVLSVFHNRRWDGDFQTILKLIRQNTLGQMKEVEMRWDRYNPTISTGAWRNSDEPGAGVFYDLGVHFLDQALFLFGTPHTISADIQTQREGAVADDSFNVTLGYENGLQVRLKSSPFVGQPSPRYALYGTEGSFVKYGLDPQEGALKEGLTPLMNHWGLEPESQWGTLNTTISGLHYVGKIQTIAGAYQHYYQNICDHIINDVELAVKPQEARLAIHLIELGRQSSREGRTLNVK